MSEEIFPPMIDDLAWKDKYFKCFKQCLRDARILYPLLWHARHDEDWHYNSETQKENNILRMGISLFKVRIKSIESFRQLEVNADNIDFILKRMKQEEEERKKRLKKSKKNEYTDAIKLLNTVISMEDTLQLHIGEDITIIGSNGNKYYINKYGNLKKQGRFLKSYLGRIESETEPRYPNGIVKLIMALKNDADQVEQALKECSAHTLFVETIRIISNTQDLNPNEEE